MAQSSALGVEKLRWSLHVCIATSVKMRASRVALTMLLVSKKTEAFVRESIMQNNDDVQSIFMRVMCGGVGGVGGGCLVFYVGISKIILSFLLSNSIEYACAAKSVAKSVWMHPSAGVLDLILVHLRTCFYLLSCFVSYL